jgi:hypothetical protein
MLCCVRILFVSKLSIKQRELESHVSLLFKMCTVWLSCKTDINRCVSYFFYNINYICMRLLILLMDCPFLINIPSIILPEFFDSVLQWSAKEEYMFGIKPYPNRGK